MYYKIADLYYWDQMYKDIRNYIQVCEVCQKRAKMKRKEPLYYIQVGWAFERIEINLVGPLTITKQNNCYIIVATDYLIRWPEAKAVPDAGAETLAKFIFEDIVCRHGVPQVILSDNGKNFASEIVKILCEKFLIKHTFSSPYHPQTNGMVERLNRTLCNSLAKVKEQDENWDIHIPAVLFAYRTKRHSTTGYTPFQLAYGCQAKMLIETLLLVENIDTDKEITLEDSILQWVFELIDELPYQHNEAHRNTEKSQKKQKVRFDMNIRKEEFEIGDKVWVQRKDLENSRSAKFEDKRIGPFIIQSKLNNGAYKLQNLEGKTLLKYYNSDRLAKYHEKQNWQPVIVIDR